MASTCKGSLGGERQPRGTLLLVLQDRHFCARKRTQQYRSRGTQSYIVRRRSNAKDFLIIRVAVEHIKFRRDRCSDLM